MVEGKVCVSDGGLLAMFGCDAPLGSLAGKDDGVRLTATHVPQPIPATPSKARPYRKCRVCARRGVRHDTHWHCPQCPSQPPLCPRSCFLKYHSKLDYWVD